MVQASRPSPQRRSPQGGRAARAIASAGWDWRVWLVVGLAFGIGYGVSYRLLNLEGSEGGGASQRFDVQPFPGTPLQSLRDRYGGEPKDIRADLDQLEQELKQQQEQTEIEKRRAAMEERDAKERQQLLDGPEAPAERAPGTSSPPPGELPATPELPAPQAPPAREREAAAPPPVAPPPLAPPAIPGSQP